MTTHAEDTTVLNTLIATLIDSVKGYRESAEATSNQRLAERFNARASERQAAVARLQSVVAALGGNPEDDGSLLGSAHHAFINLKQAVTGADDQAILNEVDRGEDYLKEKFETALANADLSSSARQAVQEAWQSVRAGHDEMSALKHSLSS
jgi:uncharacterized protein (TIGR02284 family)